MSEQASLKLGLIGNCQISALVDDHARIVWSCFPRFDGDPLFCRLLGSDGGEFSVELTDVHRSQQAHLGHTAMLRTELENKHGDRIEVIDFSPRFKHFGRTFRPTSLVRIVRPLAGRPLVRVRLSPRFAFGSDWPEVTRGSNHARFVGADQVVRLTTDAPLRYVLEGTPFVLNAPVAMILGPDESLKDSVAETARLFEVRTRDYWNDWVRGLSVPFDYQDAVIRAAITLKLSAFEETGAVVAAMTTSIPEAPASERNWDYRYCWLRDSYFVVHALNRLGATKTMEGFLRFIIDAVARDPELPLQPLYGIGGERDIEERIVTNLPGYRGMGPVRVGNDAYRQTQHDVYGAVILAATQMFFDERLERRGDRELFEILETLGHRALDSFDQPDAGIWEYRGRTRVHTHSAMMCWAGCERLARIARRLGLRDREKFWKDASARIRKGVLEQGWSAQADCFVDSFGGEALDAALLLMPEVGIIEPDDERFGKTLAAIESKLRRGDYLYRYIAADDFGMPEVAFNICTFWYIDALAVVGRSDEARRLFHRMLDARNAAGLLSEDLHVESGELWGNFPQTYSMVGLINSAMRLSRSWEEML